jgi:hypothetical protein
MQQSVIYQEWIEEGALKEAQSLVLRLLTLRIGDMAPKLRSQVQALSLPQLEALGEALLEFSKPIDLVNWLKKN